MHAISASPTTCPRCNESVATDQRFCEACGQALSSSEPPTEPALPDVSTPEVTLVTESDHSAHTCEFDVDGYCEICGKRKKVPGMEMPTIPSPEYRERVLDADLAFASDPGRKHPINDDCAAVERLSDGATLLVVADGVSTSWNARQASATAVRTIRETFFNDSAPASAETLRRALQRADEAVKSLPPNDPDSRYDEPSTTVVAALVSGDQLTVAWVGDSRAYLIPLDGSPETALTTDDSWVAETVASGKMTLLQALADKQARYITQTLGMRDQSPDIHLHTVKVQSPQRLLLCTDGLWNYLPSPGELAAALQTLEPTTPDAATLCRHLKALANERGGKDNITVAMLNIT